MQKRKVVQFIKNEHLKTGKTPSIRRICKKFGLSKKALYKAFPGRKSEMCAAAGIPDDCASARLHFICLNEALTLSSASGFNMN